MSYRPIRIADIEVDRRVLSMFRTIFPFWGILVIVMRRRNERKTRAGVETIGAEARRVVVEARRVVLEAQQGAKSLHRLTVWLVALTILNVAIVAYSVFK